MNVDIKADILEPVTTADLMSQYIIETKFAQIFPDVKIFGEEAAEKLIPSDLTGLDPWANNFPAEDFNNLSWPSKDCTIWIDPVDGTQEFVNGKLDEVTILVALAVNGRPEIGVIGKIWEKDFAGNESLETDLEALQYKFDQSYFFGIRGRPKVTKLKFCSESQVEFVQEFAPFCERPENKVYVGLTGETATDIFSQKKFYFDVSSLKKRADENILLSLMGGPDVYRVGGAGNKVLRMVEGHTDGYFYNHSGNIFFGKKLGFAKWDTAPCDVMVECLGGKSTGLLGKVYGYDGKESEYDTEGCIAVNNLVVWEKLVGVYKEYYNCDEKLKLLY
jgi:3'(2'), 5'-bisphosphate nucleotidase